MQETTIKEGDISLSFKKSKQSNGFYVEIKLKDSRNRTTRYYVPFSNNDAKSICDFLSKLQSNWQQFGSTSNEVDR